jgi:hypothetical protein
MELLGHKSIRHPLYGTWWHELLLWAVLERELPLELLAPLYFLLCRQDKRT